MDDGGMSIRLDPRRLGALKLLAAEAGVRPGELVTHWVEERLDAARSGAGAPSPIGADAVAALAVRVDELSRRLDRLAASPAGAPEAEPAPSPVKRGRGRPRKVAEAATEATAPARARRSSARKATSARRSAAARVALHDEIAAVISELGPQTAAELATAIVARGRYQAPRTAKPLDAATVNARVSNPTYRGRFVRREHRIGLAAE
jgi:hypothetical protein